MATSDATARVSEIGRYRKVYPRIWRHPGFQRLSKTGQLIAFYILSGPQTSRIGLFHFSVATAAEDVGVGVETLRKGLSEVCVTFGWHFDARARVFFVPSWWRWNAPENENVLKGNLKDLSEIPPCGLADAFAANIGTLPETLHPTFIECCRLRLPKPSPTQEQEQETEHPAGARTQSRTRATHRAGTLSLASPSSPSDQAIDAIAREVFEQTSVDAGVEHHIDAFFSIAAHRGVKNITRAQALDSLNRTMVGHRTSVRA